MLPLIVANRLADAIRPKNAGKRKPFIVRRLNERPTIAEARAQSSIASYTRRSKATAMGNGSIERRWISMTPIRSSTGSANQLVPKASGPTERADRTIALRQLLRRIVDDRQAEAEALTRPHRMTERRQAALLARQKVRTHQVDRAMRQQARVADASAPQQQLRELQIVLRGGNEPPPPL